MNKVNAVEIVAELLPPKGDRSTFSVSSVSLWPDKVWRLDTTTPGQRYYIGWEFPLPDGTNSTDECYAILLECFKVVIWGMLSCGGTYGKTLKAGSSASMGVGMRELFRWMAYFGYHGVDELDAAAQKDFLLDLPIILANRRKFYASDVCEAGYDSETPGTSVATSESGFDEPADEDDEETFSYSQALCRINTFYHIFYQKKALLSCGLPAMLSAPFHGKPVNTIASKVSKYVVNRIPPLPDEVALPLMKEALNWINFKGEDILRLQAQFLSCRNNALAAGLSYSGAMKRTNKILQGFEFSVAPGKEEP